MAEYRERTPEEREAARLERERKRAQPRDGDPRSEPWERDGHQEPIAGEALPEAEEDGHPEPWEDHQHEDEWEDDGEDDGEVPIGTRRVTQRPQSEPRPPRPRPGPRLRTRGPGNGALARRARIGRAVSLVALVLAAALIWFLVELFQPFHGAGNGTIAVTIPARSTSSQVGNLLERDGVIASSFFFELRATLAGERSSLRSGSYQLRRDMSYGQVLKILTTPPPPAKVTELTLVEGRTRRQIDSLLRAQGVAGSYTAATRHSPLLDPSHYGAPRSTPSLEGFLFPSTYQLREPATVSALVADQLRTFSQRFATLNLSFAHRRHLTGYDVLIIASMVEAEAQTARDRALIASVIYNRLAAGMPLQIDATTRYATDNYTRPLTVSELQSPSPYNTRIHKGLPPTPIDNPGMASIQAAARPASTSYLYFVVKPCGNGEQAFASSYSQFLALAQQYQVARSKHGGRSPSRC